MTARKRDMIDKHPPSICRLCFRLMPALLASALLIRTTAMAQTAAPATEPAMLPALSNGNVALLHRLEAGAWRERQSAEHELAALPPDEEPTVQAMLAATKSPEAEARLQAVLLRMAEDRDAGTSLITLHMKDATPKAAYTELFRQAFAAIHCEPANLLDDPKLPKVTIDADHQPFWTVEQQLARATNIGMGTEVFGTFRLQRGTTVAAGPQVISGPLLLVLTRALPNQGAGQFAVLVYSEPKVRALMLGPQLKIAQAIDNHGNSLTSLEAMPMPIPGQMCMPIHLQPAAKNPGDHLVHLQATLTVPVTLHPQHLEIDDLMHAAARDIHIGDFTAHFEGCKKSNNWYQLTFSTIGPDPQNRMNQLLQQPVASIQTLDAKGNALFANGMSYSTGPAGNTIGFLYQTQQAEPHRLILDLPNKMKTIDVPMDFKDVDLLISGG
jgi:hypothetical protein